MSRTSGFVTNIRAETDWSTSAIWTVTRPKLSGISWKLKWDRAFACEAWAVNCCEIWPNMLVALKFPVEAVLESPAGVEDWEISGAALAALARLTSVLASNTLGLLGAFLSRISRVFNPPAAPKTLSVGLTASGETGITEERGWVLAAVFWKLRFSLRTTAAGGTSVFTASPTEMVAGTTGVWEVGGGTTTRFNAAGVRG